MGLQARDPQVAVDGQGNVIVAWVSGTSSKDIVVAEHPAGGPWANPAQWISDPTPANSCETPALAVDSAGAAILVADCGTGTTPMRAVTRSIFGAWSAVPTEIPSSGSGEKPRVAIDDAGNAVVVWAASNVVRSSYKKASGGWEAALQVSPVGKVTHEPEVAVSPTGRAIAVWLEDRDETVSDPVVQVDSISRQGSAAWSGFKFLSGPATSTVPVAFGEPQVTIGAGGRFAAWAQLGTPTPVLKNAWGSASDVGGWGEDASSHVSADAAYEVESPRVALDGSGRAVAVFRARKLENGDFVVRTASTSFLNGGWSAQATLASGGNGATQPDVAVDPGGDAIAVWRLGGTVSALRRPAAGAFVPPGAAISDGAHPGFEEPQVVIDANGDGIVVWGSGTTPTHAAVAVDDVTPPVVNAPAPAPVQTGSAVALSASATDRWSPVSLSWVFGDGGTATGASVSHVYATAGTKTATVTATDAAGNSASAAVPVIVTAPPSPVPPTPTPSPRRKTVVVTAQVVKQPWGKIAAAKMIKLRCKLDLAGTCSAKANVTAAVAKSLGLTVGKGRKLIAIGKGSAAVKAGSFVVVKVELTPKALAAITAAVKPVPVSFAITATAGGADPGTANASLRIQRP
ncbi:MAG: PKD domain-containing protein [Solirubrobacterales bacterium]